MRRALYNRELIIFNRWRVRYSPAYGWRRAARDDESTAPTVMVDGVLYRQVADDDRDELVGDHGIVFVPVDPDALPPNPIAAMLRESAARLAEKQP